MIIRQLKYDNFGAFLHDLYINKNWELIQELTRLTCVAIKKNLPQLTIFEIITNNDELYDFDILIGDYKQILESCIEEYSKKELYEQCSELVKIKNKIK